MPLLGWSKRFVHDRHVIVRLQSVVEILAPLPSRPEVRLCVCEFKALNASSSLLGAPMASSLIRFPGIPMVSPLFNCLA
jgi:hypothetical protein